MKMAPFCTRMIVVVGLAVALSACATTIPRDALQPSETNLQERQLESRRFDTANEAKLLSAGAQVLQDLGFTLDESETKLGVITASKDRDAVEAGQVIGAVLLAVLTGAVVPIDEKQKIRVSFVTSHSGKDKTLARVTFQRVVWNTQGRITTAEALNDPEIYQEFFSKLSKSVFLTANEI